MLELVGAGILDFSQTFSLTNVREHGTRVTPGHAHLALFDTFGMLMLGTAYAVMPAIRGIQHDGDRRSRLGFWLLLSGIPGMMLSFTLGGTTPIYVYRILGFDWFGAEVRPAMEPWRGLSFVFGTLFATGVVTVVYNLLTIKQCAIDAESTPVVHHPARSGSWRKPLPVFELAAWFAALWFICFLITGALLTYNLTYVRLGDATLPYLLAGIGYPALVIVTLALAVRFLRTCEAQPLIVEQPMATA